MSTLFLCDDPMCPCHENTSSHDLVLLAQRIERHVPWLLLIEQVDAFPRRYLLVKDSSNLGIYVAFHDGLQLDLYLSVVGKGKGGETHGSAT